MGCIIPRDLKHFIKINIYVNKKENFMIYRINFGKELSNSRLYEILLSKSTTILKLRVVLTFPIC